MSYETAAQLQTIEISIDEARKAVTAKDALARLVKNRDFRALFVTGFFEQEAVRTVSLKSHPAFQDEASQTELDRTIYAIGSVQQYMNKVRAMGEQSERALVEMEVTRDELRVEDLNDE